MAKAAVMDEDQYYTLLDDADRGDAFSPSWRIMIMLLFRQGVRISEGVSIPVAAFLNSRGEVGDIIQIPPGIKRGRGRAVGMHPEVADAVRLFIARFPSARYICIPRRATSPNVPPPSAHTAGQWFRRLCELRGYVGCSTHSGRRTFATQYLREAPQFGCTIVDLRDALGHVRLDTTAGYVEPSKRSKELIKSMGSNHRRLDGPTQEAITLAGTPRMLAPPVNLPSLSPSVGDNPTGTPRLLGNPQSQRQRLPTHVRHRAGELTANGRNPLGNAATTTRPMRRLAMQPMSNVEEPSFPPAPAASMRSTIAVLDDIMSALAAEHSSNR